MSIALPVHWKTGAALDPDARVFSVGAEVGRIRVRGHLSTGTRGWVLRADAGVRRGVITLHVAAVESGPVRTPDLEFHEYEALIDVRRPGSYAIRITHSYLPRGGPGEGFRRPVHEASVTVPE